MIEALNVQTQPASLNIELELIRKPRTKPRTLNSV